MSTSRNRKSTVGWMRKGFNAGNQKALNNLVQKSQRKLQVQESQRKLKTSTSSLSATTASTVTSPEETPINIIVFDGGGMKGMYR